MREAFYKIAIFIYKVGIKWEYYQRKSVAYLLFIEKVRELMLKTRLFGAAIACAVAMIGLNPAAAFAADTDTQTEVKPKNDENRKESKALYEEKMNNAIRKWDALTADQKDEVYTLMEEEIKQQDKLLDKLAELGVMDKKDVKKLQSGRTEWFNKMRQSGKFPLLKQKGRKCK